MTVGATIWCAGVGVPTIFPAEKLLTVCHKKFGVSVLPVKNQYRNELIKAFYGSFNHGHSKTNKCLTLPKERHSIYQSVQS